MRKILKTKKFIVGGMIAGGPPKSKAMEKLKASKPKKSFNKNTKKKLNKQGSHIKRIRQTAQLNVAISKKTNELGASQKKITNLTSEKATAITKHDELEGQHKALDEEKLKIDTDIAEGKLTPEEGKALKTELTKQQDSIKNKIIISARDIYKKDKAINTASAEHSKKKTEQNALTQKSDAKKKKLGIDEKSHADFLVKTYESARNKTTGEFDEVKLKEAEETVKREEERIKIVTEGITAKASNITTKPERVAALESYKKAKKNLKAAEAAEALQPKDQQQQYKGESGPGKALELQGPGQERLRQGDGSGDIKLILKQISEGQEKQTQALTEAMKQREQGQQGPAKPLSLMQRISQKFTKAFRSLTGTTNANQKRKEENKVKRQEANKKANRKAYVKKYGNTTED